MSGASTKTAVGAVEFAAALAPIPLPKAVDDELVTLAARGEAVRRNGNRLLLGAGVGAVLAAGAFALAHWLRVDPTVSSVRVPDELLSLFSDAVLTAGGSRSFGGGVESLASGIGGTFSTVGYMMALMSFALAGFKVWAQQSFSRVLPLLIGGAMAGMAPAILGVVLGTGGEEPPVEDLGQSPRVAFQQLVDRLDVDAMRTTLVGVQATDRTRYLSAYVLAQGAVAKSEKDGKTLSTAQRRVLADDVRLVDTAPGGLGTLLDAQRVYAIDVATSGKATSPVSLGYFERATANHVRADRIGTLFLSVAGLLGLAGAALGAASFRIRRRVSALHGLLRRAEPVREAARAGQNPESVIDGDQLATRLSSFSKPARRAARTSEREGRR